MEAIVQEIRSYQVPTYIVNVPEFVKGAVNLRGVIVPILDLRLKFALQSVEYDDLTGVIVLNCAIRRSVINSPQGAVTRAVDILTCQPSATPAT
jgi:purine-binding chemotaxis protein CheW